MAAKKTETTPAKAPRKRLTPEERVAKANAKMARKQTDISLQYVQMFASEARRFFKAGDIQNARQQVEQLKAALVNVKM
jgi:hypothetical protein